MPDVLYWLSSTMAQRDHDAWIARVEFANYGDRSPYTAGVLDGHLQEISDVREILKQASLGEWQVSDAE